MTAYSLKTASKGCLTAVTLNITMAGDVHDKRAYIEIVLSEKHKPTEVHCDYTNLNLDASSNKSLAPRVRIVSVSRASRGF